MTMEDFKDLSALPGTPQEQAWLKERLETLSVREGTVLAAAIMRRPPMDAAEAIGHLQSLEDYEVFFPAGSYEQLGKFYLNWAVPLPERALYFVDLERIGRRFEDENPGQFVGNCYVAYPDAEQTACRSRDAPLPEDNDWSVKVKLATPAVPEGVWIRLPDYSGPRRNESMEVELALDVLRAESLDDCAVLDVRCILPEIFEGTAIQPTEPMEPVDKAPDITEQPAASFNWAYLLAPLGLIAAAGGGVGLALLWKRRRENEEEAQ